mmetsp:Transcript_8597/g.13314  ORF Transcript_8597/g.13314 Transcript_8597/m.13314 type:complete len:85 (+) Transcript_8597:66-320(+)
MQQTQTSVMATSNALVFKPPTEEINETRFALDLKPMVSAVIKSNAMKDCYQAMDLYRDCTSAESSSRICEAARNYIVECSVSGK